MEKTQLIERAKMYLQFLENGVHPLTGEDIRSDSVLMDERIRKCFSFVIQTLDEFVELSERVEELERENEELEREKEKKRLWFKRNNILPSPVSNATALRFPSAPFRSSRL